MDRKSVGSLRTAENDVLLSIIRETRTRAKVSQEELSKRLGQSITFMVKVERGTRRLDLVEFIRVAEALGQNPEEMFGEVMAAIRSSVR